VFTAPIFLPLPFQLLPLFHLLRFFCPAGVSFFFQGGGCGLRFLLCPRIWQIFISFFRTSSTGSGVRLRKKGPFFQSISHSAEYVFSKDAQKFGSSCVGGEDLVSPFSLVSLPRTDPPPNAFSQDESFCTCSQRLSGVLLPLPPFPRVWR